MENFLAKNLPGVHKKLFTNQEELVNFVDNSELKEEDKDVKQERQSVYALKREGHNDYPLVIKDIRKVYPGANGRPPKVANKNISFKVKNGELFGLLGPNGAGKTTLIQQLIGIYPPTTGNAWVSGYNLQQQLDLIQLQIGVCPQFDVLWDILTVDEHLLFYARIKGISPQDEEALVTKALKDV